MTEEQKQALINRCKNRIAFYKAAGNTGTFNADTLQLTEIALAALTAQPDDWKQRAEAAEAKLEELAKQQAVGVARMELAIGQEGLRHYQCFVDMRPDLVSADLHTGMELFTRPVPASDLAELVPDDTTRMDWLVSKVVNVREPLHGDEKYVSNLREQIDATILRNIEEAKTK